MQKLLASRFFTDQTGATAIEYGLIAALISVAIIGALSLLNGNMVAMYRYISDHIGPALESVQ